MSPTALPPRRGTYPPSFRTMSSARSSRSILPGFGLSLGFTLAYLGLIVLVPLSAAFLKTAGMGLHEFAAVVASPRHSYCRGCGRRAGCRRTLVAIDLYRGH